MNPVIKLLVEDLIELAIKPLLTDKKPPMPPCLVVDDNVLSCKLVRDHIEVFYRRCDMATSIELAKDFLTRNHYSYVFLDIVFPVGDGLELMRELLTKPNPPRIVLLTARKERLKDLPDETMVHVIGKGTVNGRFSKIVEQLLLQDGAPLENPRAEFAIHFARTLSVGLVWALALEGKWAKFLHLLGNP